MRMYSGMAALLLPVALGAQREPLRQPPAVPFELASALAANGGFGNASAPQILVGDMPEWLSSRIHLPAGAVVLGSAFAGTTVVAVVQVLESGEAEMREMEAGLLQKGWQKPQQPGSPAFRYRDAAAPAAGPSIFCDAAATLTLRAGATRQGRRTWFVRMTPRPRMYDPCSRLGAGPRETYPTLYHPHGVTPEQAMTPSCSASDPRGGGRGSGTGDRIRTDLSPDSLMAHYARQIADSGWTAVPVKVSEVTAWWRRVDAAGQTQQLSLSITSATDNPSCRSLSLTAYGRNQ